PIAQRLEFADESVDLEPACAKDVFRSQSAHVRYSIFDRVDSDIAAVEKVELDCVIAGPYEMGLEPEQPAPSLGDRLPPMRLNSRRTRLLTCAFCALPRGAQQQVVEAVPAQPISGFRESTPLLTIAEPQYEPPDLCRLRSG